MQQAQAEGLALRVADNKTGYFGVSYLIGRAKPYQAKARSPNPNPNPDPSPSPSPNPNPNPDPNPDPSPTRRR